MTEGTEALEALDSQGGVTRLVGRRSYGKGITVGGSEGPSGSGGEVFEEEEEEEVEEGEEEEKEKEEEAEWVSPLGPGVDVEKTKAGITVQSFDEVSDFQCLSIVNDLILRSAYIAGRLFTQSSIFSCQEKKI